MIVRAMTSESGEMCNLEDVQEIEFKEELQWFNLNGSERAEHAARQIPEKPKSRQR